MPTRSRDPLLPLLAAFVLAACSSAAEPAACHSDASCPAASRCRSGVCVAGTRPIASIRPPAAVEVFALVHLDGSPSHDPDGAGEIVDHLWTVRAVTARCAPPVVAGRGAFAPVRFGCPGGYEVSLAVRDTLGLESDPATTAIEVFAAAGPPSVLAGADVVVDHLCGGDPLVCRPTDRIALSSAADPGVAIRWSVEPPVDRPEDDARRVRFVPGPDVPSPEVTIETDGTAISGDWIFTVEGHDAYGVVGAAHTRVSVTNRPPVIVAAAPASVPHSFDAARSRFVAAGEVGYVATDPDGDPFVLGAVLRHVGDGGAEFTGELLDDRIAFSIAVQYELREDALHLIGGADLERTVEILAVDVNRVAARAAVPIVVGNRPPAPVGAPAAVRAPHRFDAAGSRYVAVAELGAWADPDGDPLFGAATAAPCANVSVVDGIASVECTVPYEGFPAANRIAGRHAVAVRVRDPWADGPVPVQMVDVLNSPPRIAVTVAPATVTAEPHRYNSPMFPWEECRNGRTATWLPEITFTATPAVSDPDGDPVTVTPALWSWEQESVTPAAAACSELSCASFAFRHYARQEVCPEDSPVSILVASDGAASASAAADPTIVFPFGY